MQRDDLRTKLDEQFQKKLQLFNSKFPTEESCVEAIYKSAKRNGKIKCYYCGSKSHTRIRGSRTNTCIDCKKDSWFTSDTFFDHARRIRAWFGVIWLREQGVFVSSNKIHNVFNVSPSTAALINKRLDKLVSEKFDESAKSVNSYFFEKLIFRRSKETPAFLHPSTRTFEQKNKEVKKTRLNPKQSQYSKSEQAILDILTDEPQTFDSISKKLKISVKDLAASISILEISGEVKRLPGESYVLANSVKKAFDETNKPSRIARGELKRIIEFIQVLYRGISWRYLQNYLANYWCYASRKKFGTGKLLTLCLNSRPFDLINLENCCSSITVRIMPASP